MNKLDTIRELYKKYPPYTALLFLWLSDQIDISKTGTFNTTIKDMQKEFTYYIGRRPVKPSFKQIRSAFYRLWEDGHLDFTTNAWGVSARYLEEDEQLKLHKKG